MSHSLRRNSYLEVPRRSHRRLGVALLATCCVACTALMVGCGGSSSDESTVVTPPDPVGGDAEPTTDPSDPPGGLVLPPGEIPEASPADAAPADAAPADGSPAKPGGFEMPEQADVPPADSAATGTPDIRYASWEEIEQHVTSTGKITVVDLWSLSCEPCLKEFPGLVRLHNSYGSRVQCVAVDMDFDGRKSRPPEYYQPRVADFLASVGADFTTYISSTPSEDIYAATDLDSIPAVLIYDQAGKIVQVFADAGDTVGFTYEKDIIPLVAKLAG
jgi:thiol-disulfide isomerase/thioredoxin